MSLTDPARIGSRMVEEVSLLTFEVGNVMAAIDIRSTHEINRQSRIDRVPHAPSILAGVINLRGQVVTVVDLAQMIGQSRANRPGMMQVLIVSDGDGERLGLLVDRVVDVVTVPVKHLATRPEQLAGGQARFFSHVVPREHDLLLVLDLAKVEYQLEETVHQVAQEAME